MKALWPARSTMDQLQHMGFGRMAGNELVSAIEVRSLRVINQCCWRSMAKKDWSCYSRTQPSLAFRFWKIPWLCLLSRFRRTYASTSGCHIPSCSHDASERIASSIGRTKLFTQGWGTLSARQLISMPLAVALNLAAALLYVTMSASTASFHANCL